MTAQTRAELRKGTVAIPLSRSSTSPNLFEINRQFANRLEFETAIPYGAYTCVVTDPTLTSPVNIIPMGMFNYRINNWDALQRWSGGPFVVLIAVPIEPTNVPPPPTVATLELRRRGLVIWRQTREWPGRTIEFAIDNITSAPGDALSGSLTIGSGQIPDSISLLPGMFPDYPVERLTLEFPVGRPAAAPVITTPPGSQNVRVGERVTFLVEATGTELAYQWQKNNSAITGATASSFVLPSASLSDTGSYTVVITSTGGSITSSPALLTVSAVPPAFASLLTTLSARAGEDISFSTTVSGTPPFSFQWLRDGVALPGATGATLSFVGVTPADGGAYSVRVSNGAGNVTSNEAKLTVIPVTRLTNLSILTELGLVDDAFTIGYVLRNAAVDNPKSLVVRAVGPSLAQLGVGGTVRDPKFELFAGTRRIMENDNWGGADSLAQAFVAVGAFALAGSMSLDAADVVRTTSADNSIKVSSTDAGVLIAEVYDATPDGEFTSSTPRLINLSVLKQVGAGLTVGIVIAGAEPKPILIRAIGPTLGAEPFKVSGAMANPRLQVFRGQASIGENDNWNGTPELSAAFSSVGAFTLSATSLDAALIANLPPGNYTVQVRGTANSTGVALIEVYELP